MKPTKDIEQLYQEYIGNGQFGIDFEKKHIIEFAVAFHKEKLREDLIAYDEYLDEYVDHKRSELRVDTYLKTKG